MIIGNPPFLGAKRLKPEHGPDYVNAMRAGLSPRCPAWRTTAFTGSARAHDHLPPCTARRSGGGPGRASSARRTSATISPAWAAWTTSCKDGTIIEAVDNQPWSGEANVHVSIVNWVKTQDPALLPKTRRLWYKVEPPAGPKKPRRHGTGPASKEYELAFRDVAFINSAVSDKADVGSAVAPGVQ